MGAIASWIASTYPDSLELIHSPFSRNIKNGKDVGDGTAFYGSGLMAAHADHVHWALGKAAKAPASKAPAAQPSAAATPMLSTLGADAYAAGKSNAATATTGPTSMSMSMPDSLSGMSSWGLSGLGKGVGKTGSGSDLSLFGDAAGAAVSGQVASAMGVFGAGDAPGWLKGISTLVGGIKIGGGTLGGGASAPVSALSNVAPAIGGALGGIHGNTNGAAPGPVYNIRTAVTEDAFVIAQRREKERTAADLARY
jgi:hypothetical protein